MTLEELEIENKSLVAKNRELLGELKTARQKARDLEAGTNGEAEELAALRAEVRKLKVDDPVAALLSDLLVAPRYSIKEVLDIFRFELNDDGVIVMLDSDGEPVTRPTEEAGADPVPIAFDREAIYQHLSQTGQFDHILKGWRSQESSATRFEYLAISSFMASSGVLPSSAFRGRPLSSRAMSFN